MNPLLLAKVSISLDAMAATGNQAEVDAALKGASRDGMMAAEAMLEAMRDGKHELVCRRPQSRLTRSVAV